MDSPSDARSREMVMRSDCTHIFGLVVNPCGGSGPDGHSRTGSSSEKRPVMASPASRVPRRRSDRSRHQLLNLALSHDNSDSTYLAHSGTRRVGTPRRQQRPEYPGLLGRQRHHRFVEAAPGFQRQNPATRGIGAVGELPHDGAGAVDQQRAEVDIPAFGDAAQPSSAATGMLPRDQSQPRGKLPAVFEGVGIPDRRDQGRGGHRSHPGGLHQPLRRFRLARHLRHAAIIGGNPLIQRPQAIGQIGTHFTRQHRQRRRLQQLGQRASQHTDTGGHDQSVFGQQAPRLVDQGGSFRDQELPGTMDRQDGLLLDLLHRDKAHVGPTDGFTDRLGVVAIILVVLPIGGDELRRDQPDVMTQRPQLPRPVMRTATGFHPDQTGLELREDVTQAGSRDLTAQDDVAALIDPMELKDVFGQINAHLCDVCHVDSLLLVVGAHGGFRRTHGTECGGVHPIRKSC